MTELNRRTTLQALGALLGAGATGAGLSTLSDVAAAETAVSGYPTYAYDSQNTWHAAGEAAPDTDAMVRWSVDTPEAAPYAPAIADGVAYVVHEVTASHTDRTLYLSAIDLASQSTAWSKEIGNSGSKYTPIVHEDRVIVVGVASGEQVFVENDVAAFSRSDGAELWRYESDAKYPSVGTLADGQVFFKLIGVDGHRSAFVALDTEDGSETWRVDGPSPRDNEHGNLSDGEPDAPAVTDGTVYFTDQQRILALSTEDGSEVWRDDRGTPLSVSPVVGDGLVYLTVGRRVVAYDPADGTPVWARDVTNHRGVSQPTVANGTVYVRDGYNTFWAIDAATGEYRWERQYDTHPGGDTWDQMAISGFYSTIVAADSKLFALAQLNNGEYHLFTFDTETGDVLNVLPARPNSTYISNPIVADGRLYLTGGGSVYEFGAPPESLAWRFDTKAAHASPLADSTQLTVTADADGGLYGLDPETGEQEWEFIAQGSLQFGPASEQGTVFVADRDVLYAVDRATGVEQWRFSPERPLDTDVAVADGTVFVGTKYRHPWSKLYALDAADGSVKWDFSGKTCPGLEGFAAGPVIGGPFVIFNDTNGRLWAVERHTGTLGWSERGPRLESLEAYDTTVLAGSQTRNEDPRTNLVAYDIDGIERWSKTFSHGREDENTYVDSIVSTDNAVFVTAGNDDAIGNDIDNHRLYRLSPTDGTVEWEHNTRPSPHSNYVGLGELAVAGDSIYAGTDEWRLHKYDANSGELLTRYELEGDAVSAPTVTDGTVLVGTHLGTTFAFMRDS
ncbi:PQQ-binding-like beta-propeller repeat protein [Haladaptatus sp. DYSN1]|uniref:outer membrane protein assembly factor BamB family protein n=1 Tax=unclassified Haladaptatus TaxID=2622732 RepID=UPI0024066CF2|nr:PQQ-binding-like beta-propeller repeat protein [Haladaptatus sp. DYSN1]